MAGTHTEFGKRGNSPPSTIQSNKRTGSNSSARGKAVSAPSGADEDAFKIGVIGDFVFKSLFGIQGRINRLGYWGFGLFYWAALYSVTAIFGINFLHAFSGQVYKISQTATPASFYSYIFIAGILGIMRISLEIRRFHDRDVSGYWYFGYLIPFFGLYLLFANSFFPGSKTRNRFGT